MGKEESGLANVLSASKRWRNTEYAITDKRVILRNGLIGYNYQSIDYVEIDKVDLRVGIIDRMLNVGDIYITVNGRRGRGNMETALLDIEDAFGIYKMLQKTVLDIKSDIYYSNNLRPKENSGYQTSYNGFR